MKDKFVRANPILPSSRNRIIVAMSVSMSAESKERERGWKEVVSQRSRVNDNVCSEDKNNIDNLPSIDMKAPK